MTITKIYDIIKKTIKNNVVKDNEILNRCDAWIFNGAEIMTEWALNHDYRVLSQEITANGDMVIWVA